MKEDIDRARAGERSRAPRPGAIVAREYSLDQFAGWIRDVQAEPPSTDAIWRLSAFIVENQESRIPPEMRVAAAEAAAAHLICNPNDPDISLGRIFVAWGAHRSDHRPRALELLHHPQPMVRREALHLVHRFLSHSELLTELLAFQRDPFAAEVGMGSPLRFWLRDDALLVLEHAFQRPPADYDQVENTAEGRAYYRSWRPFLDWYANHKHKAQEN